MTGTTGTTGTAGIKRGLLRALPRLGLLAALLLLGSACADPPAPHDAASLGLPIAARPAEATRGAPRAFLGAATGDLTITDAKATPLPAIAGAPLLADDKLSLGQDALAVLVFTNGNVLRLEGPLEMELRGLAGFNAKPVGEGLEAQLAASLSDRDRERLGAANERIGGWQLRLTALEAPAPESEEIASVERPAPDPDVPIPPVSGSENPAADGLPADDNPGYGNGGEAHEEGAGAEASDGLHRETAPPDVPPEKRLSGGLNKEQGSTQNSRTPPPPGSRPLAETTSEPPPDEPESKESKPEADKSSKSSQSAGKKDSESPALSLVGATWIESQARIKLPTGLRDELAACLRPIAGRHVIVELTLSAGSITSIKVRDRSSGCIAGFKGRRIDGVSQSGSVRLTFERG